MTATQGRGGCLRGGLGRTVLLVRGAVIVHGFELASEFFLALPRSFDLCSLSGQLRLLLLRICRGRLLLTLLLTLLQLSSFDLLLKGPKPSVCIFSLPCKIFFLRPGIVPV